MAIGRETILRSPAQQQEQPTPAAKAVRAAQLPVERTATPERLGRTAAVEETAGADLPDNEGQTAAATVAPAGVIPMTQANMTSTMQVSDARWPENDDLLQGCEEMNVGWATILLMAGVVYLLWGYQIFKWLVTLNAAALGAYLGWLLGRNAEAAVPCAVVGGFVCAVVAWPTMKYAVAVMGGLFGAVLGAMLWTTFKLDPNFAWSGAGMGLILFGLLSFIVFRGSVMVYTSLQGAVMLILGVLGLIFKINDVAPEVTRKIEVAPFLVPMALLVPMVIGMIYQNATTAPVGPPPAPPKK
ncbi:MAG TPA: DUF4203 domain-containing protein [Tepidisphaeraceae bacterium]|nr:DUF4203 domain-containing protein [Tepidisphaeraceae bacterium]